MPWLYIGNIYSQLCDELFRSMQSIWMVDWFFYVVSFSLCWWTQLSIAMSTIQHHAALSWAFLHALWRPKFTSEILLHDSSSDLLDQTHGLPNPSVDFSLWPIEPSSGVWATFPKSAVYVVGLWQTSVPLLFFWLRGCSHGEVEKLEDYLEAPRIKSVVSVLGPLWSTMSDNCREALEVHTV